jgi:hypothetical protein
MTTSIVSRGRPFSKRLAKTDVQPHGGGPAAGRELPLAALPHRAPRHRRVSMSRPQHGGNPADGWLDGARRIESPNCDERPPGETVSLIVVHAISLPPGSSAVRPSCACSPIDSTLRLIPTSRRSVGCAFRHIFCSARWRVDPVRLLPAACLACRALFLAGTIALQRLLAWHRTGGLRRVALRRPQYACLSARCSAALRATTRSRGGRAQRHLSRAQDRPGPVSTGSAWRRSGGCQGRWR